HVRIRLAIETVDRIDDGTRFLRRVRIVEIDERLAVHAALEHREIRAITLRVESVGGLLRQCVYDVRSFNFQRCASHASSRARISPSTNPNASLANPEINILRASPSATPRERK